MMPPIINSLADLERLAGTPAYDAFVEGLEAAATIHVDQAVYPPGYDPATPPDDPAYIAPDYQPVPDPAGGGRLGLSKTAITKRARAVRRKNSDHAQEQMARLAKRALVRLGGGGGS